MTVKLAKTTQYCDKGNVSDLAGSERMCERGGAYGQPLSVVRRAGGEESVQGVVARDGETGNVGQELAAEVEDDEEEVESDHADNSVGLGHRGAALEVDERGILAELRCRVLSVMLCVWELCASSDIA